MTPRSGPLRKVPALVPTVAAALTAGPASAAAPLPVAAPPSAGRGGPPAPGAAAVAYTDATVSASGRSFSARVWYPGTTSGANAPAAAGTHPGPTFGHGSFQDIS